ncbi:MAG: hypothetical protein ABI373_03665 [Flavobacteriales bacterium]
MNTAMVHFESTLMVPHSARAQEVLVFKTSVNDNAQVDALRPLMELTLADMGEWNFDLEDRDHVLRVDAKGMPREHIIMLLTGLGFACEELD